MANPALASLTDLEARGVDVSDVARAQAAIGDASAYIHTETGSVWVDQDGEVVDSLPAVVVGVCCSVVARMLRNPDGINSESIADYSVTYATGGGEPYLTKAERRMLRKASGASSLVPVELRGAYDDNDVDDWYVQIEGSSEAIVMGPFPDVT